MAKLRRGRKQATTQGLQTIYLQLGDEPADSDPCVGMMLTPDLAKFVVESVNADVTFARLVLLG